MTDEELSQYEDAIEDGRSCRTGLAPVLAERLVTEVRRLREELEKHAQRCVDFGWDDTADAIRKAIKGSQ